MENPARRRVRSGTRVALWVVIFAGLGHATRTAVRIGRRSTRVVLVATLYFSLLCNTRAGVNLDLLEDGPQQPLDINGEPVISLKPAEWWFDGGVVAAPEFSVDGGVYEDFVDVFLYCGTLDAAILFTIGPSSEETPDPVINELGRVGQLYEAGVPVRVVRNSVIKARGLHPMALDSDVAETDLIAIRLTAPHITIQQSPGSTNLNGSVQVLVTGVSANPEAPPFIGYTINGLNPQPLSAAGIGIAQFTLHRTAIIKAIAWQDGMAPSLVRSSGVVEVDGEVVLEEGWQGSLAWWELGDAGSYYGRFARARRRWGGACDELFETDVTPSNVVDMEGAVGPAVLMGPACKGGVWDVDPGGVSTCAYQILSFEGAVGYLGREEAVRAGSPECGVVGQPSLLSFRVELLGLSGLRFDAMLNRGLYAATDIAPLLANRRLPSHALTALVHLSIDPAAAAKTKLHALLAVQQDGAGASTRSPYAKGWSLLYSTSKERGDVTFAFSASLAANLGPNRHGRFVTVTHSMPAGAFAQRRWHHLAAVYDGRELRLYLNGSAVAAAPACPRPLHAEGCGALQYPATDEALAQGPTPLVVGGYDNRQTGTAVGHEGLLAGVRLFGRALGPEVVMAAARALELGSNSEPCQPGQYGPYQGLMPCFPCPKGTFAPLVAQDTCTPCAAGRYADAEGMPYCAVCPPGETTAGNQSTSAEACVEPDECAAWSGLGNNCSAHAICSKTPGSYDCTCNAGFQGDGVGCEAVCGDGEVVEGEECDDGNVRDSDGCDHACRQEQGFACSPAVSGVPNSTSACVCTLPLRDCCALQYVNCLHDSQRFSSVGLDDNGLDVALQAPPVSVVAGVNQSCHDACAQQSPRHRCLPEPVPLSHDNLTVHSISCARVIDNTSSASVAAWLHDFSALPMVDEFSEDGTRPMAPGDGAGTVCYAGSAEALGGQVYNNTCEALPSLPSARRVCTCEPLPDFCSRDCLAEQARCLAPDTEALQRAAAASKEYLPCLDNPDYRRQVESPGGLTSELTCVDVGRVGCSAQDANCSACPQTCGSCGICYQIGGRYYYGGQEEAHPGAVTHPSVLHVPGPWSEGQRATQAACKKGLAVCSQGGYEACVAKDFCFHIEATEDLNPVVPGAGVEEYASPESPSCSCLSWYRQCVASRLQQFV